MSDNSFGARAELAVGGQTYEIFRLDALQASYDLARLPFSLKILLENLLRNEDGESIRARDVEALVRWDAKAEPSSEIAFTPARTRLPRSRSRRAECSCRTSPACPPSSTSRRCGTRWRGSAAIRL